MHAPKHTRVRAHTYAREHTYEPIDAIERTTHRHTGTRMHAACARSMRSQVRGQARTHAPHERERTCTCKPINALGTQAGRQAGGQARRHAGRQAGRQARTPAPVRVAWPTSWNVGLIF